VGVTARMLPTRRPDAGGRTPDTGEGGWLICGEGDNDNYPRALAITARAYREKMPTALRSVRRGNYAERAR